MDEIKIVEKYITPDVNTLICRGRLIIVESIGETNPPYGHDIIIKMIVISHTEKISMGDKIYNLMTKQIFTCNSDIDFKYFNASSEYIKKIIVTSDKFSSEHYTDYVNGILKHNMEVLVECKEIMNNMMMDSGEQPYYVIKLNSPEKTVSIFKPKEKQYTSDDMILFSKFVGEYYSDIKNPVVPTKDLLNQYLKHE